MTLRRININALGNRKLFYFIAMNDFMDNPICGKELGKFSATMNPYIIERIMVKVHNSILEVANETGLVGLIPYLGIITITIISFVRCYYYKIPECFPADIPSIFL